LEELLLLPRDASVNGFRARELLQLQIPALTRHALASAQDALNGLQERGGSLAAAATMLVAMIFGVLKVFYRNPSILSWRSLAELVAVLALSFALGGLAKFVALALNRWLFAHRCRAQYHMLSMLLRDSAPRQSP
jgi:hypothetical protein